MNKPIAVLGAGIWGSALAILLAQNQQTVHLWDADTQHMESIQKNRCNQRHLPDLPLSDLIHPFTHLTDALTGIQDILIVVPSDAFTGLIKTLSPLLPEHARIIWATKGLDPKTARFFHEIVAEILGNNIPTAVLSGPSFAREVAEGKPTHVVLATQDDHLAQDLSFRLYNPQFRVELSHDMVGVQLCGALKNVLAIAIGMSDGLNLGANARCALITNSLQEIAQLGKSLDADRKTFFGLAGLGDIILTCTDNQSRNRRFGFALGEGKTIESAEQKIAQTIEGKKTALNAYQLISQQGLVCHFIQEMYDVLYQGKSAQEAIENLLS